MRENANCVVCMSRMKGRADELLATSPNTTHALTTLRSEIRVRVFEIDSLLRGLDEKKNMAFLSEEEGAEYIKLEQEKEDIVGLKNLNSRTILRHNASHRTYHDNQSFREAKIEDGDIFDGVNFMQSTPGTVLTTASGLVFRRCNLTNCEVPEEAEVDGCTVGSCSFCSHLHPKWAQSKLIPECGDKCEHLVMSEDELVIEGVVVARDVRRYQDTYL